MFDFIELLYSNSEFLKYFGYSILILVTIFLIVLFLGLIDAHKKKPKLVKKEEDISFNNIISDNNIITDVTFEIPSLTKDLEDFKKNIETAIQTNETDYKIYKHSSAKKKKNIILDKDKIESTNINID